jgi:hypothetical protein
METMYAALELAAFPGGAPREPDVAHAGGAQNYRPSNRRFARPPPLPTVAPIHVPTVHSLC